MTKVLSLRKEDVFSGRLRSKGIEVICCPMIETVALDDQSGLIGEISRAEGFDGVFLTSSAAARIFVGVTAGESSGKIGRIYSLGESTRRVLAEAGLDPVNYGPANTAEEMLEAIGFDELRGKRFLYICGDRSLRVIPERLEGIAEVTECVAYRTVNLKVADGLREEVERTLRSNSIRLACFFSPSSVASFAAQFTARNIDTAAIGPTTGEALKEQRFGIKLISPSANAKTFADAVAEYIKKEQGT